MKKYIGFLIVLSLFVLGGLKVEAAVNPNIPCDSNASPSITVLSPNGGESYNRGQEVNIKWKSCNVTENVFIALHKDGEWKDVIYLTNSTINDGNETLAFAAALYPGSYKIRIGTPSAITQQDFSDNLFTIKNTFTSTPSVTVLSPNGGETYQIGSTNHLTWSMNNFPSWDSSNQSVQIQLWDMTGQNFIGAICVSCISGKNGGSYNWTIGQVIGPNDTYVNVLPGQYKIRISTVSNVPLPEYNYTLDFSDRPFTVTNSVLSNVLPDGCNSAMGFSSTTGLPCFLDTYPAISITKNGAVLNGRLIANAPAEMYFIYAKTGNGNKVQRTEKITQQSNGLFSYTLSSLSPNTSYDFKACMYYVGAERCARQLTFKTFSASHIEENDGCKNSEIYSSTTGQKCSTPIELEQKCDPATDCYKKEIPVVTTEPCNSAVGCPQKETPVIIKQPCNSPAGCFSTSSPLSRVLKVGVKGEDVKFIQSLLGITADGSYGPITASKVKEWQTKNMLKADGIFGAQSMSIISQ